MNRHWPHVRWERAKFVRWAVRNPRSFLSYGRYARATGMHLSLPDRFRGLPPMDRLTIVRANMEVAYRQPVGTEFWHDHYGKRWTLTADGVFEDADTGELWSAGAILEQYHAMSYRRPEKDAS